MSFYIVYIFLLLIVLICRLFLEYIINDNYDMRIVKYSCSIFIYNKLYNRKVSFIFLFLMIVLKIC